MAASFSEQGLVEDAYWTQVGEWVEAVQLGQFYEGIARSSGRGDYGAVSSSGTYRGAYQYDQQTDPRSQDQVAADTYARRGNQPWGGRC